MASGGAAQGVAARSQRPASHPSTVSVGVSVSATADPVLKYTRPLMIGSKWGTKVVAGATKATLNFQLSKGAASIGGSTQVKNYGSHSGDTGGDPNLNVPKTWRKYDVNRVNAFYISSHDLFFQGTGSDEGNVGHALYEFDTKGTVNFRYGAAIQVRAFCAEVSCPAGF